MYESSYGKTNHIRKKKEIRITAETSRVAFAFDHPLSDQFLRLRLRHLRRRDDSTSKTIDKSPPIEMKADRSPFTEPGPDAVKIVMTLVFPEKGYSNPSRAT
jgi:hypothetical protein